MLLGCELCLIAIAANPRFHAVARLGRMVGERQLAKSLKMSTRIFHITTNGGHDYTGQSRDILKEQLGALEPGRYKVVIEKVGAYKRPTRYKFYFSVIMAAILEKCSDRFQIINPRTGETSPPRTTADIHEIMKAMFNPVIIMTPKGATNSGGTTTNLSDRDFINEYSEMIMSEFSSPPFNVEFLDPDEWREIMKTKRNK